MTDLATGYNTADKHGPPTTTGEQLNSVVGIESTKGAGSSATVEEPNPYLGDVVLNCVVCHRAHPKAPAEWPDAIKYDLFSF